MTLIKRNSTWIVIITAIVAILFFVMILHNISISRQLNEANSEITKLTKQLAAEALQHCEQTYQWQSNQSYSTTLISGGIPRRYRVHTPPSYTSDQRYPVIVAFDGLNGTSERAEHESGLNNTPALTVYPDAYEDAAGVRAWQGAPYSPAGVNDVQFVDEILTRISQDYCIDSEKVYTVGMSNGAGIAFLAACELKDRITGVAGISGAYYMPCRHGQYVQKKMLIVHSFDDELTPYTGSIFKGLPPIYDFARTRSRDNGCKQVSIAQSVTIERYDWTRCRENRQVSLIVAHRQSHGWLHISDMSLVPDGSLARRTTSAMIWDFFTKA